MVDVVIVACMMHKAFSHSFMAAIYKMYFADEDDIDSFKAYHNNNNNNNNNNNTIAATKSIDDHTVRMQEKKNVKKNKIINHFHFFSLSFFFRPSS